jgi:hypothetical protein
MRTSIDFPDPLFRTLKASAAMQGITLRDYVLQLIERGMQQPAQQSKRVPRPVSAIPTVPPHYQNSLPATLMSNAGINELLDREEFEKYLNVVKHGRGSGSPPGSA